MQSSRDTHIGAATAIEADGQSGSLRLARLFRAAAAAGSVGAVVACGGGSSGGPIPPPPPAPPPSVIPAVLSVPTPVGYNDYSLAVFNRLNEIRFAAGLGLLAQDGRLDVAAQAHSNWEIMNDKYQHNEIAGTLGFTGVQWWDRTFAAGYQNIGGAEIGTAQRSAVGAVDSLVSAIYHRAGALDVNPVDIGIGYTSASSLSLSNPLVIEITTPNDGTARSAGQTIQTSAGGIVLWPTQGDVSVYRCMGAEIPNPVPSVDVNFLGMPISVSTDYWKSIQVIRLSLRDATSAKDVEGTLLTYFNDPNGLIANNFVAFIPGAPLNADTSYSAHFEGVVDGVHATRDWTFRTGSVEYPS